MPWNKTAEVAMYEGADWNGLVSVIPACSPQKARRIALADPAIQFFFHCRQDMVLTNPAWAAPRRFSAGDCAFFTGTPQLGSAIQADTFVKDGISVAYFGTNSGQDLAEVGCYVGNDGSAIDVVCIFAANICQEVPTDYVALAPQVAVPDGGSHACGNPTVMRTLRSGAIEQLQAKGITVLLTFLNNHDDAGWSKFSTPAHAANFVAQLTSVVDQYGLDGIDIDDEYSTGHPLPDSLAMVASMMRTALPGKIISKALFADRQYFRVPYQGMTLEQTLTYGWEMTYGAPAKSRLAPYVTLGMAKNALVLGFWSNRQDGAPDGDVAWLKQNNFAGTMVYAFEEAANVRLLGQTVLDWCGPGSWRQLDHCPQHKEDQLPLA